MRLTEVIMKKNETNVKLTREILDRQKDIFEFIEY